MQVKNHAIQEAEVYVHRLVKWFEEMIAKYEGVNVEVSDMVFDFVKDVNEKWYMLQVKGFRFSRSTEPLLISRMKKCMGTVANEDNVFEASEDDVDVNPYVENKKKTQKLLEKVSSHMARCT
jgi:hypothetical protein